MKMTFPPQDQVQGEGHYIIRLQNKAPFIVMWRLRWYKGTITIHQRMLKCLSSFEGAGGIYGGWF